MTAPSKTPSFETISDRSPSRSRLKKYETAWDVPKKVEETSCDSSGDTGRYSRDLVAWHIVASAHVWSLKTAHVWSLKTAHVWSLKTAHIRLAENAEMSNFGHECGRHGSPRAHIEGQRSHGVWEGF